MKWKRVEDLRVGDKFIWSSCNTFEVTKVQHLARERSIIWVVERATGETFDVTGAGGVVASYPLTHDVHRTLRAWPSHGVQMEDS